MTPFLLADNPFELDTTMAIIHTQEPQAIIEVLEGHDIIEGYPYRHYSYKDELGREEEYTLRVHHLFTREFDNEQHNIITTELLDQAWDWYEKYLKWGDGILGNLS